MMKTILPSDSMRVLTGRSIRYVLLGAIHIIATAALPAQTLEWERRYIEPKPDPRVNRLSYRGQYVTATRDGGLIVLARTGAGYESAVLKTDAQGLKLWEHKLGSSDTSVGASLLYETEDDHYETVGRMTPHGRSSDTYYFFRATLNANGVIQQHISNGPTGFYVLIEPGYSFVRRNDGSFANTQFINAGPRANGMRLRLTNANGSRAWYVDFYEGDTIYLPRTLKQLANGDYLIFGERLKYGSFRRTFLMRTDSNGVKLWEKSIGAIAPDSRYARAMILTADGGIIALGYYATTDSITSRLMTHLILTKATADGELQWERMFDTDHESTVAWSVEQMRDGGYIIAGHTGEYAPSQSELDEATLEFYLIRTDETGSKLWTKEWGTEGKGDALFYAQQSGDGSIIMTGVSGDDGELYLAKLTEPPASVQSTNVRNGIESMTARLLHSDERIEVSGRLSRPSEVRLSVVDMMGREVIPATESYWSSGSQTRSIDVRRLASGAYIVSMSAHGCCESRVVVLSR